MNFPSYNNKLRDRSRELRKKSTYAEILLWNAIKQRKILGYQFRRQVIIHNYIVDFYCHLLFLAIEVDGQIHDFKVEEDITRQKELESLGINVLRFTNDQVIKNLESVITRIYEIVIILANSPLEGSPRSGRGV